jgi:hypothetical protein
MPFVEVSVRLKILFDDYCKRIDDSDTGFGATDCECDQLENGQGCNLEIDVTGEMR